MKLKKCLALLLSVLTLLSLLTAAAFAQKDVLTFSVNDFGNAQLDSCDPSATGTVTVPSTVEINGETYNVRLIADGAFKDCVYVQRITIEEGVTQIGNKAFENCTGLETVDVPKTLMSCQYDAFDGCNTVTVNGYKENYQFFAVYGLTENIQFVRKDTTLTESQTKRTNALVDFLRRLLATILSFFGIKL